MAFAVDLVTTEVLLSPLCSFFGISTDGTLFEAPLGGLLEPNSEAIGNSFYLLLITELVMLLDCIVIAVAFISIASVAVLSVMGIDFRVIAAVA